MQRLTRQILAALDDMGIPVLSKVAGPIRWQAVFFIGPAASGKSFVRDTKYLKHLDFKAVDPDEIKKLHPEYDPEKPFKVHQWSKVHADAMFKDTISDGTGTPVIVDGTGRNIDGILKKANMAKKEGYRTYLVYVFVPFEVSIYRNRNRPRFVPEEVIMEQSQKIMRNFGKAKGLVDKYRVIKNFDNKELIEAKKDIAFYPVPQDERPPRPGDSGYGVKVAKRQRLTWR